MLNSSLRKRADAIYSDFHGCKNDNFQLNVLDYFLIFAQNIYCGYTLEPPHIEAVLTSTHNICFRAKIRK